MSTTTHRPTTHGATTHGATAHGPTPHGATVHGPGVHRPAVPAPPRSPLPASSSLSALSPRERLILRRLEADRTLAQIAAELFVSRNTVKTQVQSVYRKLGVRRRADAVALAHDLRLG